MCYCYLQELTKMKEISMETNMPSKECKKFKRSKIIKISIADINYKKLNE